MAGAQQTPHLTTSKLLQKKRFEIFSGTHSKPPPAAHHCILRTATAASSGEELALRPTLASQQQTQGRAWPGDCATGGAAGLCSRCSLAVQGWVETLCRRVRDTARLSAPRPNSRLGSVLISGGRTVSAPHHHHQRKTPSRLPGLVTRPQLSKAQWSRRLRASFPPHLPSTCLPLPPASPPSPCHGTPAPPSLKAQASWVLEGHIQPLVSGSSRAAELARSAARSPLRRGLANIDTKTPWNRSAFSVLAWGREQPPPHHHHWLSLTTESDHFKMFSFGATLHLRRKVMCSVQNSNCSLERNLHFSAEQLEF